MDKFMSLFGQQSNSKEQIEKETKSFFYNIIENTLAQRETRLELLAIEVIVSVCSNQLTHTREY